VGFRGRGYGRIDLRMNDKNEIFLLESNSNPGIFYEEPSTCDEILSMDPNIDHDKFFELIL
jgi:hypothetical protein